MKRILVVATALFALGCQQGQQADPASVAPPELVKYEPATEISHDKPMLPAYKLPGDLKPLKGDEFSTYKDNHPETYGITVAPSVGFRPVAEYETAAKLMITYSSNSLPAGIKNNLVDIVKHGKDVAEVVIVYGSNSAKNSFSNTLKGAGVNTGGLDWVKLDNDSIWMRDYGPVPILSDTGKVGMVDLRYYHQRIYDDAVPTKLASLWNISVYRAPIDFEGGNFMSDTQGNCFASEGLLWYNSVGQSQIEKYMKDYLGCDNLYIVKPLQGEGTTHIDMQAKIVDDDTVIVGEYGSNQDYANWKITNDNAALIESKGYEVVRMPMPSNSDGNFRTYINSLFVSGVNMVPIYSIDKSKEAEAMQIWEQVMPAWDHIGMNSDAVIAWAGAIHCITMTTGSGSFSKMESNPGYACGGDWSCYPGGGPTGCDGLTYEGCCDGNVLKYCENNQIKTINCGNQPQCGWDSQNKFYNCGTNGGSDPSGKYPKDCGGGCEPNCAGKECGGDGCGGSCGTCAGDETCQSGQCVGGGTGCGDITYQGCCDGNVLNYCNEDKVATVDCGNQPKCGWDAQNKYYDCDTNGGSDPSGQYPKACDGGCVPGCTAKECGGDGCGGSCGTCPAGEKCQNFKCVCKPDCSGKNCGSDGCGGSCGTCSDGFTCNNSGKCIFDCEPDCSGKDCGDDGCGGSCGGCADGQMCKFGKCEVVEDPCLGITWEGCCEGNTLHYCEAGGILSLECGNAGCGWNAAQNFYDCSQSGSDPSGTNPKDCPGGECIPNCADKNCGNDGCGGSCGTCSEGWYCNNGICAGGSDCGDVTYSGLCEGNVLVWCEEGKLFEADCGELPGNYKCEYAEPPDQEAGYYCVQQSDCDPDCTGKQCGDDGCGGSCGACGEGESCKNGQCEAGPCEPDCTGAECGDDGCGGNCGLCPPEWKCENGQCVTSCQPNCQGSECGDDGCGGSCGSCPLDETCKNGKCEAGACEPDCTGAQCGDDGCGGSCGACGDNETCQDGACVDVCQPDCTGKDCGDDGCSGSCGVCDPGFSCKDNECIEGCDPDCAGMVCGDDGCGGSCGSCPAGEVCTGGACAPDCILDCEGKSCGPDGCGGTCGDCPKDFSCDNGNCVQDPEGCGNITSVGECEGTVLKKCVSNQVITIDCGTTAKVCSFVPNSGVYDCVAECIANCGSKECGDDGCGGTCGTCAKGEECNKVGRCDKPAGCTPVCTGKVCGPDGCGGFCGACTAGQSCDPQGQCVGGGVDKDVVEQDTSGEVDEPEETSTSDGGCSTTGRPAGSALFLLLAMLVGLGVTRRFSFRSR